MDFVSLQLYPEKGKVTEALATLRDFTVGKPVLIDEPFPLHCSVAEFGEFVCQSGEVANGWLGFYWGRTPAECRAPDEIADAMTLGWLEFFRHQAGSVASFRMLDR